MRKPLRMLLLALTVLFVPAVNALDMQCFPGTYVYNQRIGWRCEFDPGGTQCLVCYAVIVVEG
jgi:hypothetical protein